MFTPGDLEALHRLNALRASPPSAEAIRLEARFADRFGADRRLAVYGSLAPGRANHHHLSPIEGEWVHGLSARGELLAEGWGSDLGFPALRWSMTGPEVPVALLVSGRLTAEWERLDRFEGRDYLRALVPLFDGGEVAAVANLYVGRQA